MRFIQKVTRSYDTTVRTECDLCGKDVAAGQHPYGGDRSEVEIGARFGMVFDGDDTRKVYEIDCCPTCFLERVKPAIEALGVKFRERRAHALDRGTTRLPDEEPKR